MTTAADRAGSEVSAPGVSVPNHQALVRDLLARVYDRGNSATGDAFVKMGMSINELVRLFDLMSEGPSRTALEIGMGSGTSAVVMCQALAANGGGHLTSIDPFQSDPTFFGGRGVVAIKDAGFEPLHTLLEEPDYTALPTLVASGQQFDFILVDGYHSFDYTFVDLFYADLLLRNGGILAVHDTTEPTVYKACRFLELHKPYERLSPPLMVDLPGLAARLGRRVRTMCAGSRALSDARSRRVDWKMLGAYRKLASLQIDQKLLRNF